MLCLNLGKIDLNLKWLDEGINKYIPAGRESHENKQVKLSKDYQELYNAILNKLALVLETEIDIKNIFTKKMVENALIGPDGIINDTTFWEDLEDQVEYEIPMYLYESTMMDVYIKNKIKSRLYNTLA